MFGVAKAVDNMIFLFQSIIVIGIVKFIIESFFLEYFLKKPLSYDFFLTLAINILSTILIFIFSKPLFNIWVLTNKTLHFNFFRKIPVIRHAPFTFFIFPALVLCVANILCGLLLNKLFKLKLTLKQLCLMFACSNGAIIILSMIKTWF